MMPKAHRLPKDRIRTVFKIGRRTTSSFLTIFFLPGTETKTRIAIAVKKSVVKKAAERSRIKRTLRSAAMTIVPTLQTSFDIIIFVNHPPTVHTTKELIPLLQSIFLSL